METLLQNRTLLIIVYLLAILLLGLLDPWAGAGVMIGSVIGAIAARFV